MWERAITGLELQRFNPAAAQSGTGVCRRFVISENANFRTLE
jgi:hypothetical protein